MRRDTVNRMPFPSRKVLIAFIAAFILLALCIARSGWDLTYLLDPRAYELEGQICSRDGYLTAVPQLMTLDHRGLRITVRYQLDPQIENLGLSLSPVRPPRLMLEINPQPGDVHPVPIFPRDARALYGDDGSDDVEYFFPHEDASFQEGDVIRVILGSASLQKRLDIHSPLKLNEWHEMELDGLGVYRVRVRRAEDDQLLMQAGTESALRSYLSVGYTFYSMVGDTKLRVGGGSGSGSASSGRPQVYTFTGRYAVDPRFWEGELHVGLQSVTLDVDCFDHYDRPYVDLAECLENGGR
ncbi:MAG: hypothetical protein R6U70_06000 [Bacillota bacterium]